MRLLLFSASPYSETGYGTAIKGLIPHLSGKHDLAVFAYSGSGDHKEEYEGVPIFFNPEMGTPRINWLAYYDKKFKPDIILSWFDLWIIPFIGDTLPEDIANKFIGYGIVDSVPLSPFNKIIFKSIYKLIPPCRWSKMVIESAGIHCEEPIYHGVDTKVFHPIDKALCRKKLGIPEDGWVFLFCGTNFDLRKNIPNTMLAFKKFLDKHPDARKDAYLILHTDPVGVDAGYNLLELWTNTLGEKSTNIIFTKVEDYRISIPVEGLVTRYNAADVLVMCSLAEGFGFPPLEAACCGIPSILTGWGPLEEVWDKRAYMVDVADYFPTQRQLNWYCFPSTDSISAQMEYTYFHRDEVKLLGGEARKFALTLSWGNVCKKWLKLLAKVEEEKSEDNVGKFFSQK